MDDKSADEKPEDNSRSESGPGEAEGRHLFGGGPGDQGPADIDHMKEQLEGGGTATSEPGKDAAPASAPDDLFGSKGAMPKAEDR